MLVQMKSWKKLNLPMIMISQSMNLQVQNMLSLSYTSFHWYINEWVTNHSPRCVQWMVIKLKLFHCLSGSPLSSIPAVSLMRDYERLMSVAWVNKSMILLSFLYLNHWWSLCHYIRVQDEILSRYRGIVRLPWLPGISMYKLNASGLSLEACKVCALKSWAMP